MKEEDLPREYTDILGNSVHERLNIMIHDIIEHSQDKPEVAMSPEREEAMHGLRRWMFDHVYHDGIAKAEEGRAQQMIEMLYGYYMAHPEELPEESHRIMEVRNETKERAVCDYIAGMTDIYAIDRFKELFIPKAWSYKEEEMYYPEEVIEEVRMRSDIVDVISGYVKLQKKGSNLFGLCPFHHEKSPSFSVSPSKQMYHCFGCGVSGNVITFVMEYENYSFREAVEMLADRSGVKLPKMEYSKEAKAKADRKAALLEINKLAANYFITSSSSRRER